MEEIELFTNGGDLVVKVKLPPFVIPADAVAWGERIFLRREDGKYYEGFVAFGIEVPIVKETPPEDRQTCPRRQEGPQYAVENADCWKLKNWKFTDPEKARQYNQEKADRDNAEAKAKGFNSTSHPNHRYWLWPGPGPMPRTCSYCGGIHPADALRLKKEFKFEIGSTTKGYKVYIEPPGFGMEQLNSLTNMQAGVDPIKAFQNNKVESIYPPLKAYSPHFTAEQWRELLS